MGNKFFSGMSRNKIPGYSPGILFYQPKSICKNTADCIFNGSVFKVFLKIAPRRTGALYN